MKRKRAYHDLENAQYAITGETHTSIRSAAHTTRISDQREGRDDVSGTQAQSGQRGAASASGRQTLKSRYMQSSGPGDHCKPSTNTVLVSDAEHATSISKHTYRPTNPFRAARNTERNIPRLDEILSGSDEPSEMENGRASDEYSAVQSRDIRENNQNEEECGNGTGSPASGSRLDWKSPCSTPTKAAGTARVSELVDSMRTADRSARRKSARTLIRNGADGDDDADELGEEQTLAQRIWEEETGVEEDSQVERDMDVEQEQPPIPDTPSKRGRGRPRGSKRKCTPTPPGDLLPHEHYFFQNRPGGTKTSNNTLSSLSLITHEDYFNKMQTYRDPHEPEIRYLHSLHSRSFDQWIFELEQDFNICLYGWGSKRTLLISFATHFSHSLPSPKIIIINGFNPALTIRDILTTLASTIPSLSHPATKLGAQPTDMLTTILTALSTHPPPTPTTLLIHSLDSPSLRRPIPQSILAHLASSPSIHLIATADTPSFPLLWDVGLKSAFNFCFHDVTTFVPFDAELAEGSGGGGVVDEVNKLLGRSGRKVEGREGVGYVLRSLTGNARELYALLLGELLAVEEQEGGDVNGRGDEGVNGQREEEDDNNGAGFEEAVGGATPSRRGGAATAGAGVEYRTIYQKAASRFIAGNEVGFRTLLKEFLDHQMVTSRRDGMGAEVLSVPFRREEMEAILEDLGGAE